MLAASNKKGDSSCYCPHSADSDIVDEDIHHFKNVERDITMEDNLVLKKTIYWWYIN